MAKKDARMEKETESIENNAMMLPLVMISFVRSRFLKRKRKRKESVQSVTGLVGRPRPRLRPGRLK